MIIISTVFFVLGVGLGLNWFLNSRFYEETDNAYVQGNVVQITPQIAGTVVKIYADDTDLVKTGQTLVSLDPSDTKVAVDQAEAELAQTVREVRTLYTSHKQSDANLVQRQVELKRAEDDLLERRKLALTGTISKEELRHAEAAVNAGSAAVDAAREQLSSGRALTDGTSVRRHPTVQRASAHLRELLLAMQRATLLAPVSGQIAKRSVQLGQRVNPGAPLMAVIPLDQLWVDANFKEGQLRDMRVGQPVTLISDLYGSSVKYTGKVIGMGAGTGGAFALLPAQNATGNWIKVVQRVPVRIALEPAQLAAHPLRIGLSMRADVDLHDQNGNPLATVKEATTYSFETPSDSLASTRVNAIIDANLK
jgi:membrane fusion protein (multidrug efflux system)